MKWNKSASQAKTACAMGLLLGTIGFSSTAFAGCEPTFDPMTGQTGLMGHPCAQPHPGRSIQTPLMEGGVVVGVEVDTPPGQHPAQDPFENPPGSNFLMTVYENLTDFLGDEMPNTLPSTPTNPYNLHDGPVLTQSINPNNPEDDLDRVIDHLEKAAKRGGKVKASLVQLGIDILEGNPVEDRAYSGFPMLHYNGPHKVKKVQAIRDSDGNVVGGNVDVNMIYFGQHIENDTAYLDPSDVLEVPWTVTYHVNILRGGIEDFSPMVMTFNQIRDEDGNPKVGPFHASMDQSYFPMLEEGTKYTVKIKETKGKYYNLTYTWGWRIHPPRVQVMENALKVAGPPGNVKLLPLWEIDTFGADPMGSEENKLAAIAKIGELSPAKRMWTLLRSIREDDDDDKHHGRRGKDRDNKHRGHRDDDDDDGDKHRGRGHDDDDKYIRLSKRELKKLAGDLRVAFLDWKDRTKLPTGVEADENATLTLFYVNNTIYGSRQGLTGEGSGQGPASFKGISNGAAHDWNIRPYEYNVTLLNGDHFLHGYVNVDFGGSRGWENHFQYTDPTTTTTSIAPHPEVPSGHPAEGAPYTNPENVIAGHDQTFPINRGGIEEFLQPTPRNTTDPVNGNPQLGSGCFFTFGRHHAWPSAGGPWGPIGVPPVAADGTPTMRKVKIHYNFEPSRRLKIYQFDPLHHDVAVYSLH